MSSHDEPSDAMQFDGFRRPNYTPVPDELFDLLLPVLSGAELHVLLYIIRRTFGFKKDRDSISFNQFVRGISARDGRVLDGGCGIRDRTTLSRALRTLEDKQVIVAYRGVDHKGEKEATLYALRFADSEDGEARQVGVVGLSYHPGRQIRPPVVGEAYLQETVMQETDRQETEQQQHTAEQLVVALSGLGVTRKVASELVQRYPMERIAAQIDMLPYRAAKDPPAVLVQAIREDWAPPSCYEIPEQREARSQEEHGWADAREEHLRMEHELRETWRDRVIEQYGIDQATIDLWEQAKRLLLRFIGPSDFNRIFSGSLMALSKTRAEVILEHPWQKLQITPSQRKVTQQVISSLVGTTRHVDFVHGR